VASPLAWVTVPFAPLTVTGLGVAVPLPIVTQAVTASAVAASAIHRTGQDRNLFTTHNEAQTPVTGVPSAGDYSGVALLTDGLGGRDSLLLLNLVRSTSDLAISMSLSR
jgi:hypothetical protein